VASRICETKTLSKTKIQNKKKMGNSNSTSRSKNNSSYRNNRIILSSNIKDSSFDTKKECQICIESYPSSFFVKITSRIRYL
jgi:hypothetical protein